MLVKGTLHIHFSEFNAAITSGMGGADGVFKTHGKVWCPSCITASYTAPLSWLAAAADLPKSGSAPTLVSDVMLLRIMHLACSQVCRPFVEEGRKIARELRVSEPGQLRTNCQGFLADSALACVAVMMG